MKLKPTYIFFILVCILSGSFNSFSQQRKIDSLLKILPLGKDSARVKVLLKLASGYKRVSWDTAINYANVALNESQKINHTRYEYDAVFKLGDLYREKGEFALSLKFLTRSLEIGKNLRDTFGMGQTYNSLGNTHNKMGNYPVALSVFQKSLTIKEKYGDKNGMANTFINIGNIYDGMSIFDKAEEYILKGSKLKEELGDKYGVAGALNNLCIIYNRTKKVDKAILTLESIRKDYIEYLDPYLKSAVLGNLAEAHQSVGQLKKASTMALESLKIREEMGDSTEVSYSLITLADIEAQNKNYVDAIKHAQRALQMGKKWEC